MVTVHYYCRGCGDYGPHLVLDSNKENPLHDYTKIGCVHENAEPFVIEHEKGKPPTQYSKRVEMANPEE